MEEVENLSYIAQNQEELFERAPEETKKLILGEEINTATAVLGKLYHLPISLYVGLENIITFILIGALKPEDVLSAIKDILELPDEIAYKLATDIDKTILEKARVKIFGKSPKDIVELTFQEGRTPDELRKEILDTTKRESAFFKEQSSSPASPIPPVVQETPVVPEIPQPVSTPPVESTQPQPVVIPTPEALVQAQPVTAPTVAPVVVPVGAVPIENEEQSVVIPSQASKSVSVAPGSRSQLLEQLQILGSIPDDEEVADRLSKIQEQVTSIESKNTPAMNSKVPLHNFMFGEKGDEEVEAESKLASYSKAPTKYNVDPYRETADES